MAHTDNEILRTTRLAMGGHGWEEIVGDALRRIPGVAKVGIEGGRIVIVDYDPSLVLPGQFVNLAQQAGFEAHLAMAQKTGENPAGPL